MNFKTEDQRDDFTWRMLTKFCTLNCHLWSVYI